MKNTRVMVAATAATPSLPMTGSFCTPSSRVGIFRSLGSSDAEPLGQLRQFTMRSAPTVPNWG